MLLKHVNFYKSESTVCCDWPAIRYVAIARIPEAYDGNITTPLTIFGISCSEHYNDNKSHAFFLCIYIWAVLCKSSHTMM